ncbi:A1 cistron-splicing factor AAR2 [Chloropicon primus]|nr:A1 cistron-splicing factor AAR2 [Chloropicon primus]
MASEANLVVSGVPKGVTVVLDYQWFDVSQVSCWTGVRGLSAGVHFCATTMASGRVGQAAAGCFPTGFFFVVEREGQNLCREWSEELECLVEVEDEGKRRVLEERSRSDAEFLMGMLRYDPQWEEPWRKVAGYVTPATIARVSPVSKCIGVGGEPDDLGDSVHEARLQEQLGSASREGGGGCRASSKCFYLDIPKGKAALARQGRARGIVGGRDLTRLHLDKSPILEDLVGSKLGGDFDELLGELQFAFVCFLMCQSLAGFLHWRDILTLVFQSERAALETQVDFSLGVLRVLRSQLDLALRAQGGDASALVDDIFRGEDHFLKRSLKEFFLAVQEADAVPLALEEAAESLKGLLQRRLGLFLPADGEGGGSDDDDDEYAPVVVQL